MTCLILCRSLTGAQRARNALNGVGIRASMIRPSREIVTEGCGYAVEVEEKRMRESVAKLKEYRLTFGRVYCKTQAGYVEAVL